MIDGAVESYKTNVKQLQEEVEDYVSLCCLKAKT